MEFSRETFEELYSNLRAGENVEEVSSALEQFYLNPNSIPLNLEIAEETTDAVMKQYALYGICVCIRKVQTNVDEAILSTTKNKILQFLASETEETVANSIIAVIGEILTYWQEWNEFTNLIFDENTPLEVVLKLLSQLLSSINSIKVIQSLEYFQNLILKGLQSSESNEVLYAMQLLFTLAIPIKEPQAQEKFMGFYEQIFVVMQAVIPMGDAEMFMKMSTPIMCGLECGLCFIPTQEIFDFLIEILQTQSFETEYTLHLNNFMTSILINDPKISFGETEEDFNQRISVLFQLELNIAVNFFDIGDFDPTMNWLFDFDQMFNQIYNRLKPADIIELTQQGINMLSEVGTPNSHAAAILILQNAIAASPWEFVVKRNEVFDMIMQSFKVEEDVMMKMSMRFLEVHAPIFSRNINENATYLLSAAINLMHSEDTASALNLFNSVLKVLDTTDNDFENIVQICLQLFQTSNPGLQTGACSALSMAIEKSKFKVDQLFNDILNPILEILSQGLSQENFDTSVISPLFSVITSLAERCPELILPAFDPIMQLLIPCISSPDIYTEIDAINCFMCLTTSIPEACSTKFAEVIEQIRPFFSVHWNSEIAHLNMEKNNKGLEDLWLRLEAAICALKTMIQIASVSGDLNLMHESIVVILSIVGINNTSVIVSSMECYIMLSDIIAGIEIPQEIMILFDRMIQNILYNILGKMQEESIVAAALRAISKVVSLFGPAIIEEYYMMLPPILLNLITDTFNEYNGYYIFNYSIFDKDIYIPMILNVFAAADPASIQQIFLPMLDHLLTEQGPDVMSFAIDVTAQIFVANPEFLPEEFRNKFIELVIKLINDDLPTLALSASNFLAQLCGSHPAIIANIASDVYNIIIQKLLNNSLTSDILTTVRKLKECLSFTAIQFVAAYQYDFKQVYQHVLAYLPYESNDQYNDAAFRFVCQMSASIETSSVPHFVRPMIVLFARSIDEFQNMDISDECAKQILQVMNNMLEVFPDKKVAISQTLQGNEMMIANFAATTEKISTIP